MTDAISFTFHYILRRIITLLHTCTHTRHPALHFCMGYLQNTKCRVK